MLGIKLLVSFFILGFLIDQIDRYLSAYKEYTSVVITVLTTARTLGMMTIIAIAAYFIYSAYQYLTSKFYSVTKIPIHEAFFHGYIDLSYAYERLFLLGDEVDYDTKTKAVIVKTGNKIYYILVRDIFGKLQGEAKNDTWYICSKKKKEYGRVSYKKRVPIKNPIFENREYIKNIKIEENKEVLNYVCITGLRQNTFQNDQINTIYELESIIRKA